MFRRSPAATAPHAAVAAMPATRVRPAPWRRVAAAVAVAACCATQAAAADPTTWLDVIDGVRVHNYDHPGVGIASIGHAPAGPDDCSIEVRLDSATENGSYWSAPAQRLLCRFRVRLVLHEGVPKLFEYYRMRHDPGPPWPTQHLPNNSWANQGPGNSSLPGPTHVEVHFWPHDAFDASGPPPTGPVTTCQQRADQAGANRKKLLAEGFRVPVKTFVRYEIRYGDPNGTTESQLIALKSFYADTPVDVTVRCIGNAQAANEAYPPPERTKPFKVASAYLTLFHNNQPLPAKVETDCSVPIGHRVGFTTTGELPGTVKYHFEWTSGQRSTGFSKGDKGDRKDPLYEPPTVFHEFPYPLPAKDKAGGGGEPGAKGFASKQAKEKGPSGEAAGPAGPANVHKGSVRVVASNASGDAVASGWAPYHIVCKPKLEVLSGTLDLRDTNGSACPRRVEAALSLRTNVAGPVPFSLDCTGNRAWSQTATAHETAPGTYIAVAVLPFEVKHKEHINCALKSRLQSPPKIVALRGRAYDCAKSGPDRITTGVPSGTGQPPRVVVDPPRPVCVGGKLVVQGRQPVRYACQCPAGQTALSTGADSYLCKGKTTASITCTGGSVRNGQCFCPSNMQKIQAGANAWRCLRRGTSAAPASRPQ
jgi:hypothetical protein